MTASSLRTAVDEALSHPRPENLISGVKNAIIRELEVLDPAATIRSTDYFNHSFAPDLVLEWSDAGRKVSRDVFLRYSMRATASGHDVAALAKLGPVLIALRDDEDPRIEDDVRQELANAPKMLLTNTPTLDELSPRSRTAPADGSSETRQDHPAPLFDLVRSNIMRGGRGLLVEQTAAALAEQATPALDATADLDRLEEFTTSVHNLFVSDAATRLNRAAQLLWMGLSGDLTAIREQGLDPEARPADMTGGLSDAELAVLLPYLLSRDDVTSDPDYWAHLGSMITLERLERMWDRFLGVDLTRLVEANLDSWFGWKAQVGFRPELEDLEPYEPWMPLDRRQWLIHAKAIAVVIGPWIVHVVADLRKLRGRHDSPAALWSDLSQPLRQYNISAVTLAGLLRTVRVDAENSADVYQDVANITASLNDEFRVPAIELKTSDAESTAKISADFTRMLVSAVGAPVSIGELVRVALGVLVRA